MANLFIVQLGALFHDVADHKFGYSDEDRERIISDFLKTKSVLKKDIKDIDEVVYIVNNISFKGGTNPPCYNTEVGWQKAEARHKTMEYFLQNFYSEWGGIR